LACECVSEVVERGFNLCRELVVQVNAKPTFCSASPVIASQIFSYDVDFAGATGEFEVKINIVIVVQPPVNKHLQIQINMNGLDIRATDFDILTARQTAPTKITTGRCCSISN
jgi:hypothetical protein